MSKKLIEQCYQKSIELLLKNSTELGVLASSPSTRAHERDYLSIFARDASICSLGMILSGNKKLIKTAKNSLKTLATHQADDGEIPNYVKPKNNYVDFWKLGSIDATLWWLVALKFYDQYTGDKKFIKSLDKKINKAINWLYCHEHKSDDLLVQPEASDWADIMPRSGRVLYDNALWYEVKKLYNLKNISDTKRNFNNQLFPFVIKGKIPKSIEATAGAICKKQKPTDYYLSFAGYLYWGQDVDVYGNSLAVLFGLPSKDLQNKIVNNFLKRKVRKDLPMPVLFNPIKKDSEFWREYMKIHNQNFPYQYHNGGIWPFASCFWAMALKKSGRKNEAWQELEKIAQANEKNNWQFNEWFNAKTGEASGMHFQSWNAGAFVLAYHFLKAGFEI